MRGAKARTHDGVELGVPKDEKGSHCMLKIDGPFKSGFRLAIPSFLTLDSEWQAAVNGVPSLTLDRYMRIRKLINRIIQEEPDVDYIIFPECSIPQRWIGALARKLAARRISLIAGLEYRRSSNGLRNEAYISIATDWPWHKTSVVHIQSKFAPAHEERRALAKVHKKLFVPPAEQSKPTIIQHENFSFAVLICSDLTNISHRHHLQGKIDTLIVIEWNRDTETFGSLVEATANDLHAYVVQSNNRQYGDSRIRAPRKISFERDLVRVRGGLQDYFVVAELEVQELRKFQRATPTSGNGPFKPTPIGYKMSDERGGRMKPRRTMWPKAAKDGE
jgi:hypothetical protein